MNGKNQLICETMARLMEISVNAKEKDGTDVFANWVPHCDMFDVNIHLYGWKKDEPGKNFILTVKGASENIRDRINKFFSEITEYLEKAGSRETEIEQLRAEAEMLNRKACEVQERIQELTAQTKGDKP